MGFQLMNRRNKLHNTICLHWKHN